MTLGSIHDAAANGDLDTVKKIVEQEPQSVNQDDRYEWRPIFHAGLRRHYDVVKYLIDCGADLAAHDGYAIHYAGEVPNNKEVVSLLIAYGGLDAHAKPSNETARQFIYAVFLANVQRVNAMLRDNPKVSTGALRPWRYSLAPCDSKRGPGNCRTVGRQWGRRQCNIRSRAFSAVLCSRSWTCRNDAISRRTWCRFTSQTRGWQNGH